MDYRSTTIKGAKWTTIASVTMAFTAILKISVLARFLDKTDFGLIAIVTFVLNFTNLFIDLGITAAILHVKNISKLEYSSLYWLNFFFSLILFFLIASTSKLLSNFYSEPQLVYLIPIMGSILIISSVGRQFKVIEQKNLNFRFISLVEIITAIISLIFAVVLAVLNFGVYALVYSAIINVLFSNIIFLNSGIRKFGLKLHFSFKETKHFLKIGLYSTGGQILNYLNKEIDVLIIGRLLGTEVLGLYSLAKQLVNKPLSIINPIFTKISVPVLAKMQEDNELLKNSYLKLIKIISSINFIVYFFIFVFANQIVKILYGDSFIIIAPVVRILSLYMFLLVLRNPLGTLTIATGKTNLEFYWSLSMFIIMPITILISSYYNVETVAFSMTFVMLILFIPMWYIIINKMITTNLREYIKAHIPDFFMLLRMIKMAVKK